MRLLVVLIALSLVACDPTFDVRGRLIDHAGMDLPGVEVRLACPEGAVLSAPPPARTDAQVRFRFGGVGCLAGGCTVTATLEGGTNVQATLKPEEPPDRLCPKGTVPYGTRVPLQAP